MEKTETMEKGYNERIFKSQTLRGRLHFARYHWLKKKINKYCPNAKTILELGCFDAKTVNFLPEEIDLYHGFDANWEKGLDYAKEKYKNIGKYKLELCTKAEDFTPNGEYDISICMETFEHLPEKDLEMYLAQLSKSTKNICFVTVPNEKGLMLLIKYFVKKFILRHVSETYSKKELLNGFLNNLDQVKRNEGSHKGFDYEKLIEKLKDYFEVVEINGIPINWVSKHLYFTVGIVLKKR